MEKRRILIYLASTPREGRSSCYLKILLDRLGYETRLCHARAMPEFHLITFNPHILILPQVIEQPFSRLAHLAKKMGSFVVVIRAEGTIEKGREGTVFAKTYTKSTDAVVDLELVWGQVFRDIFIKYTDIKPEKIKVCGVPRFDAYFKPLSRLLISKKELCKKHGFNKKNKIIALATGFVYADVDIEKAKRTDIFADSIDWLGKMKLRDEKHRGPVMEAFLNLAKNMPDVNFIIKPHPAGNVEFYARLLDEIPDLKNVKILSYESIENIVMHADIFLHVGSTSSTEAWLFGKPTITLNFFNIPKNKMTQFCNGGDIVKNMQELKNVVLSYMAGKKISVAFLRSRKNFSSDWYGKLDGKSTKRCIGEIQKKVRDLDIKPHRKIFAKEIPGAIRNSLKDVIRMLIYSFEPFRRSYLKLWFGLSKEEMIFIEKTDTRAIFPNRKLEKLCAQIKSVLG